MTPIILYQNRDNDATAAALAAWCAFGATGRYIPVNPSDIAPWTDASDIALTLDEMQGAHLILLGFTPTSNDLQIASEYCAGITIIDHNEGAAARGAPLPDNVSGACGNRSTATLAWEHFMGPDAPTPRLYTLIEDRALGHNQHEESDNFAAGLRIFSQKLQDWALLIDNPAALSCVARDRQQSIIEEGIAIRASEQRHIADLIDSNSVEGCLEEHQFFDFCVPIINAPRWLAEDLGRAMRRTSPDAPFAVTYYDDSAFGARVYQLHSDESGQDLEAIAAGLGGTGTRTSATIIATLAEGYAQAPLQRAGQPNKPRPSCGHKNTFPL